MTVFFLSEILETGAASDLLNEMRMHSGDILLDGSKVKRLGGRCFEILLSAHKTALARNHCFEIKNASPELENTLMLLGGNCLLSGVTTQ